MCAAARGEQSPAQHRQGLETGQPGLEAEFLVQRFDGADCVGALGSRIRRLKLTASLEAVRLRAFLPHGVSSSAVALGIDRWAPLTLYSKARCRPFSASDSKQTGNLKARETLKNWVAERKSRS